MLKLNNVFLIAVFFCFFCVKSSRKTTTQVEAFVEPKVVTFQSIAEKWLSEKLKATFPTHYKTSVDLVLEKHGEEVKKISDAQERSNFFFRKVRIEFDFFAIINPRYFLIKEYHLLLQKHYPKHELLKLYNSSPEDSPEFGEHVDNQLNYCKSMWLKEFESKILPRKKHDDQPCCCVIL